LNTLGQTIGQSVNSQFQVVDGVEIDRKDMRGDQEVEIKEGMK
jgi:hypothetical protein